MAVRVRLRLRVRLLFLMLLIGWVVIPAEVMAHPPESFSSDPPSPKTILMLDVDNTLYVEQSHQIEAQIVQRIHQFVARELKLPLSKAKETADALHAKYGSTVEGLARTVWNKNDKKELLRKTDRQRAFYESVYAGIDCRSLLALSSQKQSSPSSNEEEDNDDDSSEATTSATITTTKTGYSHPHNTAVQQRTVRRILQSTAPHSSSSRNTGIHIASNSPVQHIQKVIQASGLVRVPWTGLWTPDHRSYYCDDGGGGNTTARTMESSSFPTKLHPEAFWGSDFLQQHGDHVTLIDDSATTLAVIEKETNFQTILLSSSSSENGSSFPSTLPQALAVALGWLRTTTTDGDNCYTFDDAEYLRAKNRVDENSIHAETWKRMIAELSKMLLREQPPQQVQQQPSSAATLQIVDVGAGLLSMLKLFLLGSDDISDGQGRNPHPHMHLLHHPPHKQAESRLPSALATLQQNGIALDDVHYYAYEPNRALESPCIQVLQSLGFSLQVQTENDDDQLELVFVRRAGSKSGSSSKDQQPQPRCTVYLRFWDFKEEPQLQVNSSEQPTPHLILGCCFADLLEPYDLVSSLMRCFLSSSSQQQQQQQLSDLSQTTTLVYFPITFAGITQFLPPQPFELSSDCDGDGDIGSSGGKNIPSDTTAFSLYSQCLSEVHGHNLEPHLLETAVRDYGGTCLGRGKSDWVIDPDAHHYLWRTLLYFFGSVAAPELHCAGWNARRWLDRARQRRPSIQARNVDLLFRLPHLGAWSIIEAMNQRHSEKGWSSSSTTAMTYDEILFSAPRQVTTVQKNITETLAPDEIRIQTECSLISSGTELKIFTGSFDAAALDVNIQGMEEERMAYPFAYGYSLVGRVVECGTTVPNAEQLLGKRVFTFSAHATQVVTTRSAVQLVPDGCDALDAIFMPSVETALSLVQDARPLIGENVAVFGQGLIGLLVTAILGQQVVLTTSGRFGTITTFDTFRDRLAASAAMGATQALLPSESSRTLPFDVAIEVSGNGRALQTAIDKTRNGGRIVIGSWYGNKDVQLKLGIDFHRSHKTLIVSQVSEVSTGLRQTWSKERRFALTWELVKSIRPSRLLTRITALDHAQEAFESLEQGDEIAVAFEYNN